MHRPLNRLFDIFSVAVSRLLGACILGTGCCLATLSFGAAAQQNGVTLFGIIDLGLEYDRVRQRAPTNGPLERNVAQTFLGMSNGVQSGSRWGMRGSESLGAGLAANFVLINGFNSAQGTAAQGGRLFGRQSTIGLTQRHVGSVDLGRRTNVASDYFLSFDPFSEGFGQANIGSSFGSANTLRYGNMVLLQATPSAGLSLGVGYSFATELSAVYAGGQSCASTFSCPAFSSGYNFKADQNMRALTLGAKYSRGPLDLAVAYDRLYGDASQPEGNVGLSMWMLGGSYDFTRLKLSVIAGRSLNGFSNGQAQGTGATSSSVLLTTSWNPGGVLFLPGVQATSYLVGLTAPLSAQTNLLASWQLMQPQGLISNNAQFKAQQILSAALTQDLTLRTNIYSYVSYGLNFAMFTASESLTVGIGIRHKF